MTELSPWRDRSHGLFTRSAFLVGVANLIVGARRGFAGVLTSDPAALSSGDVVSSQLISKFTTLLPDVEVTGALLEPGLAGQGGPRFILHLKSPPSLAWMLLPGNQGSLKCETYPQGIATAFTSQPPPSMPSFSMGGFPDGFATPLVPGWTLRDMAQGELLNVRFIDPATGAPRNLAQGDTIRLRGVLVIEGGHPDVLHNLTWLELHPFDWQHLTYVAPPTPGANVADSLIAVAPLYLRTVYGGSATNDRRFGHPLIDASGRDFRNSCTAHLTLLLPVLPPGIDADRSVAEISEQVFVQSVGAQRSLELRQSHSSAMLVADAFVRAPPDPRFSVGGAPPQADVHKPRAFYAKYRVRWTSIWFDDDLPPGSRLTWLPSGQPPVLNRASPTPFSGNRCLLMKEQAGLQEAGWEGATAPFRPPFGSTLFTHVFLPAASAQRAVMLQFFDGSWEHRAAWGPRLIDVDAPQLQVGPLPAVGVWNRLEVPAAALELEGRPITGMRFKVLDGSAAWDVTGYLRAAPIRGGLWRSSMKGGGGPIAWTRWSDDLHRIVPGYIGAVELATTANQRLHALVMRSDGTLWHTSRLGAGAWQVPGDVLGVVGAIGHVRAIALAGNPTGDELHVVAATTERGLWHTMRLATGVWQPWGEIQHQGGILGGSGPVRAIAATTTASSVGGGRELHVIVSLYRAPGDLSFADLVHTIRRPDGRWQPLADVKGQIGEIGSVVDVAAHAVPSGSTENLTLSLSASGTILQASRLSEAGAWTQPKDLKLERFGLFFGYASRVSATSDGASGRLLISTVDGELFSWEASEGMFNVQASAGADWIPGDVAVAAATAFGTEIAVTGWPTVDDLHPASGVEARTSAPPLVQLSPRIEIR